MVRAVLSRVLAELMGDTPKVAFDHYGREWGQHYQEPLWAAIEGHITPDLAWISQSCHRFGVSHKWRLGTCVSFSAGGGAFVRGLEFQFWRH